MKYLKCVSAIAVLAVLLSSHPGRGQRRIRNGRALGPPLPCRPTAKISACSLASLCAKSRTSRLGAHRCACASPTNFALDPLTINDAHVAISAGGAAIQPGSDHAITFSGRGSVDIPPGAAIFSDPVDFAATPLSTLAVSFYLPPQIMRAETFHTYSIQDNYYADGDVSERAGTTASRLLFFAVLFQRHRCSRRRWLARNCCPRRFHHRWRSVHKKRQSALARRSRCAPHRDPNLNHVSVTDEGIGGNRVLNEGLAPSALSRLDRDVLSQDGVRYLIVLESIDDIGRLARSQAQQEGVNARKITAQQLEWGLKQIADAAHQHGIKAIAATLTPYCGATCLLQ